MDIGFVSPFLNIKEFNSVIQKDTKDSGFLKIFNQELAESPKLDVKQFKISLESGEKNCDEQNLNILKTGYLIGSMDLNTMSLNDEIKDPKRISAQVPQKEESIASGITVSVSDDEDIETLLSYISSMYGMRNIDLPQTNSQTNLQNAVSVVENGKNAMNPYFIGNSVANPDLSNDVSGNIHLGKNTENSIYNGSANAITKMSEDNSMKSFSIPVSLLTESGEVDLSEMVPQLSKVLQAMKSEGKSFAVINIEPPEFGKIVIEMNTGELKENVSITANNESVKNFIISNSVKIKEALSAAGVEMKELNFEKISFSGSKPIQNETENLTANSVKTNNAVDNEGDALTGAMKEFVSLFSKKESSGNRVEDTINGFSGILNGKLNNEFSSALNDIENLPPAQKIIDTVFRKISQSISEGKKEIEIKLMPENLGRLTVKIISEEGKLSANIEVKNLEVKQALDAGIVKLKDNLGQSGIFIEQINVSLSDDYYSRSHQEQYFDRETNGSGVDSNFVPENIESGESMKTLGYNTLEYIV